MKLKVIEGNRLMLDGGAMFGNAPKELWQRWIAPDEKNRIALAARILLLQTEQGQNILFDAGVGLCFDQKLKDRYGISGEEHLLLKNLESLGLKESDIDGVILSHLHFDHAGGLLSPYKASEKQRLLFPKASYYIGKSHWEYAKEPHLRERSSFIPLLTELLANSGRVKFIDAERMKELPKELSFSFSFGHTIGLLVMAVENSEGVTACPTDLIPGIPWMHLPITMGYDRYPEFLVDEKSLFLEEMRSKKARLFLTHDPTESFFKLT